MFEHGYVLDIAEHLGLGFLAEFETNPQEVFFLEAHQRTRGEGSDCGRTGCFAVDAHVSKVIASVECFGNLAFGPVADADCALNDDVEVAGGVALLEDDLPSTGLKVLQSVHDFFVGVASGFEEELMVEQYGFNHVPIIFSEVVFTLIQ